jgi:hypothetical protein
LPPLRPTAFTGRAVRVFARLGTLAAVVLAARWLAYAVAPEPDALAARLQGETAPPDPLIVAAVVVGIAATLATAVVWLAAMGVAERRRLEPRALAPPPISLARLGLRTLALFVASSFAFAGLESYLHLRAGLGFHGLHCLIGPVHQDALPFLGGLSLLAAALAGAAEHALAWIRRSVSLLAGGGWRVARPLLPRVSFALATPASAAPGGANRTRGPPGGIALPTV